MLKRSYDWVFSYSSHPKAFWLLVVISFLESSVFPIPPDLLLIPMVLATRTRWLVLAMACTLASVLGGLFGYAIGYFLYDTVGKTLIELYGYTALFAKFQERYNELGSWIVFIAGTTPFPYKVITIASGATQLDLSTFTIASIFSRGLRFILVAGLLFFLGPSIRSFIEKRLGLMLAAVVLLIIAGFVIVEYFL